MENKILNENDKARIQNEIVLSVKNEIAKNCINEIFEKIMNLDNLGAIIDDYCKKVENDFISKSFMTEDLELTPKQKEAFEKISYQLMMDTKKNYISTINRDNRVKDIVQIVEFSIKNIIEETLKSIAQEINRGAIINSIAVSADTKNEKYNKIELNHSKRSGDITIPTQGVFISTNCIDIIMQSLQIEIDKN